MTLHTRVAVTSGDVTPEAVFAQCRRIIGATDECRVIEGDPLAMALGQGLPALMWVDSSDGEPETCGDWCESDCSGVNHDPAHLVMAHFDTAYSYKAYSHTGTAHCGDLHACIVARLGRWLDAQGCTWRWYDESGHGWDVDHLDLGALGNPRLGAVGLPGETR